MKYVCEACERLVEPTAFLVEKGALELTCPRCEGRTRSESTQRPAAVIPIRSEAPALEVVPPPEVVPPSERCPKRATPKRGRDACAKCGLVFELYTPELDAGLEALRGEFAEILSHWGEPEAQRAIDRAGIGRLGTLARLCRHHLADHPDDTRGRALLQVLHERSLAVTLAAGVGDSDRSGDPRRQLTVAAILVILLGVCGVMVYAIRLIH